MIDDSVWELLQDLGMAYPPEPYVLGVSRCHWFPGDKRQGLDAVLARLPDDLGYLELGSFVGAGSTSAVLRARPQARLVCVDHWLIRGDYAARHALCDPNEPGTEQPCVFTRNEGEAWQHFLNNTWEDRRRVLPIRQAYSSDLMRELHARGLRPDLVLIDDDHREEPLTARLRVLRELWPQAHLLLDDFYDAGVKAGYYEAVDAYLCPLEDSELLPGGLMWVKPSCTVF
jgi:hypothetical protein